MFEIIAERLEQSRTMQLFHGSHGPGEQMCAVEMAAWLVGDEWTDHPECVCPVLGAFMRSWNDGLKDTERTTLLLPLIPRLINTRGSHALADRRATMAADWLIRTHTVAWLRLAKLDKQADMLASLPEITDFEQCPSLMPVLTAVRDDAAAAWVAAQDAAGNAAWAAAWAAARDALKPTQSELQASALSLVERMCALTDHQSTENVA